MQFIISKTQIYPKKRWENMNFIRNLDSCFSKALSKIPISLKKQLSTHETSVLYPNQIASIPCSEELQKVCDKIWPECLLKQNYHLINLVSPQLWGSCIHNFKNQNWIQPEHFKFFPFLQVHLRLNWLTLTKASYTLSIVRWSPSSTANFLCRLA